MIKKLLKGYGYAASSASATTIKDADGLVLCQLEGGKQGYFIATTNDIDVGTSDVEVVQVRGTSGGCSGGGGGVDPTPYIEEIERLEAEIEILEGQITTLEAEVAELEEDVEQKAAQITALNEQIATLQAQIATLQARIAELEAALAALTPGAVIGVGPNRETANIGQHITSGTNMFANSGIQVWYGDLPNLTEASGMFAGTSLTTFVGDMPKLENAWGMFQSCSSLATFDSSFGEESYYYTNINQMFAYCASLTEFSTSLPEMATQANEMFTDCTSLTTFSSYMPYNLQETVYMFAGCTSLRNFNTDMPQGLQNAEEMFTGCVLSKVSVQRIVDTIPYGYGSITIGYDSSEITQAEEDAFNTTLVGKGWTATWQRN